MTLKVRKIAIRPRRAMIMASTAKCMKIRNITETEETAMVRVATSPMMTWRMMGIWRPRRQAPYSQ
jgi:hypothetical protein